MTCSRVQIQDEIRQKIEEYSTFIKTVLQPNFEHDELSYNIVKKDIDEYEELNNQLVAMIEDQEQPSSQTIAKHQQHMVDLGYKTLYCKASIVDDSSDPSSNTPANRMIFIHVGMGFHIEMTLHEGVEFVAKRIQLLKEQKLIPMQHKLKETTNHIDSATSILRELQKELDNNNTIK